MGKRIQGIVIGVVIGLLVAGGVAYAAYTVPNVDPQPTDRYFGCFSSVGKLKATSVQVNTPPTQCPAASDVIRSWYAKAAAAAAPATAGATELDFAETNVTVAASDHIDLAPVDTSGCRAVSVHWIGSVGPVALRRIARDSGRVVGYTSLQKQGSFYDAEGGSVYTGGPDLASQNQKWAWPTPDDRFVPGPRTGVRFFAVSGTSGATVEKAWLLCTPFT